MHLFEIEAGQIDRELERVAGDIGKSGSRDDGRPPMQGAQQENVPDDGPLTDTTAGEMEKDRVEKIDSFVFSSIKSSPYVTSWRHREGTPTHPMSLASLNMDDLMQSRNVIKSQIQLRTLSDKFGTYADDYLKYLQDMVSFVEEVINLKKAGMKKNPSASDQKRASFKKQEPSKNAKPKEVKVKNRSS